MAARTGRVLATLLIAGLCAAGGGRESALAAAEAGGASADGSDNRTVTSAALDAADLRIQFAQEDGPESGHVRVTLTPETRALTRIEARDAAEQAFLHTLREPGLGDPLQRVRVVVRLLPLTQSDPEGTLQVVVFERRSDREWSVRPDSPRNYPSD